MIRPSTFSIVLKINQFDEPGHQLRTGLKAIYGLWPQIRPQMTEGLRPIPATVAKHGLECLRERFYGRRGSNINHGCSMSCGHERT